MISQKNTALGMKKSTIREIFEYAKIRKAEIGAENVFDFSIGNPSVPCPEIVNETLRSLLCEMDPVSLHGYTSAQGDPTVRGAIANYLNQTYQADADASLIYLTAGAAAALATVLTGQQLLHHFRILGDDLIGISACGPGHDQAGDHGKQQNTAHHHRQKHGQITPGMISEKSKHIKNSIICFTIFI